MNTVLIVEDEHDIREDLADVLRDNGYQVFTASNGAEGIRLLREQTSPHVILLDLVMPVMNGYEFRDAQSKEPEWAGIPTVIMSGDGALPQRAFELQVQGLIPKPFTLDHLLETVSRFCS